MFKLYKIIIIRLIKLNNNKKNYEPNEYFKILMTCNDNTYNNKNRYMFQYPIIQYQWIIIIIEIFKFNTIIVI